MEEPTPKAGRKTPRKAAPKPPPATVTGKGQAKRAEPKPNQAKKTSAATATGRRSEAVRAVPEPPRTGRPKPAARPKPAGGDQATRRVTAKPPDTATPSIKETWSELVQLEIDLPDGALRRSSTATVAPAPTGTEPTAPEPSAPESSTPESSTPESSAPESSAPESSTPGSSTLESSALESSALESSALESCALESRASESTESKPHRPSRRARPAKAAAPATTDPTPASAVTAQPVEAAQPAEAAQPVEAQEPVKTPQPVETPQPAEAAQPVEAAQSVEAAQLVGVAQPGRQHDLAEPRGIPLWAHLLADPGFAPEHVARAAVRELGPQASAWVEAMRERYPSATPDGIARLAARELTRDARRMGAATPSGGPAVLATAGVLATAAVVGRTQARLVLTIAAAYGVDPTAEERVRDLLALLRVPRLTEPTRAALTHLARVVAGVAVCRVAARVMPFGSAIAGAVQSDRATAGVALRARECYGRLSTSAR